MSQAERKEGAIGVCPQHGLVTLAGSAGPKREMNLEDAVGIH